MPHTHPHLHNAFDINAPISIEETDVLRCQTQLQYQAELEIQALEEQAPDILYRPEERRFL